MGKESWVIPQPKEIRKLTADEVLSLPLGCRVYINGDGVRELCTVAGHAERKFLTYRKNGLIKRFAINDYPGKYYTMEGDNG